MTGEEIGRMEGGGGYGRNSQAQHSAGGAAGAADGPMFAADLGAGPRTPSCSRPGLSFSGRIYPIAGVQPGPMAWRKRARRPADPQSGEEMCDE